MTDMNCLECPNCGREVFCREDDWYSEDEEEVCRCGALLSVTVDEVDCGERVQYQAGVSWSEDVQLCPQCNPYFPEDQSVAEDYRVFLDSGSCIDVSCPECDKVWIPKDEE